VPVVELAWERSESDGRIVLNVDGRASGELTWRRDGPGVVVVDHTFVEPALRGRGYALKLVEELVRWAREDGLRIEPDCWYVRRVLEADAALAELIAS
jgi:uncharacterized protein